MKDFDADKWFAVAARFRVAAWWVCFAWALALGAVAVALLEQEPLMRLGNVAGWVFVMVLVARGKPVNRYAEKPLGWSWLLDANPNDLSETGLKMRADAARERGINPASLRQPSAEAR